MPFFDRFWWLRLFGVPLLLGFAAGYAVFVFWFDTFTGSIGGLDTYVHALMACGLILFGILFGVLAILHTAVLVVGAWQARARQHIRRQSLAGDLDAMPLAMITVDVSRAPNVSTQLLELRWRPTMPMQAVALIMLPLISFVVIVVIVGCWTTVLFAPPLPTSTPQLLLLAVTIAITIFLVAMVLILGQNMLPNLLGKTYGVTASDEGITQHTQWGRRRLVHWHEARLLEVRLERSLGPERLYILYGDGGAVRWEDDTRTSSGQLTDYRMRNSEPVGISAEQLAEREQALLDVIAAQTGLTPRTCDKSLREQEREYASPEQAARTMGRVSLVVVAVALGIMGTLCLAFGAAILLLPATTWLPLNLISALGLTVIGGALLALAVRGKELALGWLKPEATAVPRETEIETEAGSSLVRDDVSAVYALAYGIPPTIVSLAHWIAFLFLAVALPALLLPVELLAIVLPSGAFPAAAPQLAGSVGVALALVVAPIGLLGVALFLLLRRLPREWTRFEVRADVQGLTMTFAGKHSTALPWSAVRALRVVSLDGVAVGYGVMDKEPESASTVSTEGEAEAGSTEEKQQESSMAPETDNKDRGEGVLWPAGFARWRRDIEGATPISPAELAALVERRSGVKLVAENYVVGIFAPRTRGS